VRVSECLLFHIFMWISWWWHIQSRNVYLFLWKRKIVYAIFGKTSQHFMCQRKTEGAPTWRWVPLDALTDARHLVVRRFLFNPYSHSRIQQQSLTGPVLNELNPFIILWPCPSTFLILSSHLLLGSPSDIFYQNFKWIPFFNFSCLSVTQYTLENAVP
jgi:hypothetical protein